MVRNGVVATSPPRIAPKDAPDGKCKSLDGSVFAKRMERIGRACWCESTGRREQGRDTLLVETNGQGNQEYEKA